MSSTVNNNLNALNGISSGTSGSSSSSTTSSVANPNATLSPTDFINLMVTQLQNQDPTDPTSSSELLTQMSEIGQLEASSSLQTSLTSFGLQTSVSAASSMIGKSVQGLDANGNALTGVVTSVQIASGNVSLGLDSGSTMALSNLSSVAPAPTTTTTTGS